MTSGMLDNEKILITGATGKIAFPIARALAQHNDVWGAARLRDASDRDRLTDAGITPIALDMSKGDFSRTARRFHLRVPRRSRRWYRRVVTVRRDERAQFGRLVVLVPRCKGFRVLFDRLDLRLSRPTAADRVGPAWSAVTGELQLLQSRRRSGVHVDRQAVPTSHSRSSGSAPPTDPKAVRRPIDSI